MADSSTQATRRVHSPIWVGRSISLRPLCSRFVASPRCRCSRRRPFSGGSRSTSLESVRPFKSHRAATDRRDAVVRNPNPTATLDALYKLLVHLTTREGDGPAWLASDIHFFGFGQGGSVAAELGLHWSTGANKNPPLGSITSISAPLVSHPTLSKKCATPALLVLRRGEERSVGAGSYRKGYENVQEVGLGVARSGGQEMLRGRDEWEPVMRFWATRLRQRSALEFGEDVYVVKSALDAQGRPIGGR